MGEIKIERGETTILSETRLNNHETNARMAKYTHHFHFTWNFVGQ